jgi:hypothetical protein
MPSAEHRILVLAAAFAEALKGARLGHRDEVAAVFRFCPSSVAAVDRAAGRASSEVQAGVDAGWVDPRDRRHRGGVGLTTPATSGSRRSSG